MNDCKKYVAELIGTFVLVLFGCGTAIATECSTENYTGYIITALSFGLAIVAMAYSIGNISGCHVNPAVSLAMLISGRMSAKDFVCYVIAQCGGAIGGAAILGYLFDSECGYGANVLYDQDVVKSLVIEIILTFVFVITVLGATAKSSNAQVAGIVIGLSLTLVHIIGIYFTGTSVNPARSLGPAIFADGDAMKALWVFVAAPLVGAALASVTYECLDGQNNQNVEEDAETVIQMGEM